ncbi:hypothetical protein EV715DRAFT_287526 [Schizophyllum commune]
MPCSERSTTCGAEDHTRTTDDWIPARSVIRVARSSLACSSQAKNTPPMMLVQASKSPRQRSQLQVMPMQVSKTFFFPLERPKNCILTPNAPRYVEDIDVLAPSPSGPYIPTLPRNLLAHDLLPTSLAKFPPSQNRR